MQVIATAGHVDHGKSTLVRALTGMEPDRWEEERKRGLTIDLGFAWTELPGGERLAFVDVPGHERFVPNMLAGLGPVPAVLMVVAADGGWMPQSAEHLAAVDSLGISRGLLAVTRADLADPGPALRQATAEIAATSLGAVEAIPVSAVTGSGLPALRNALARLAGGLPEPDQAAPVRLWVDRAFSIKGSGTVVTGTLPAGTVRLDDELLLTPSMRPVRVRSIESLGESREAVSGVARVALNLRGVAREVPGRGMALVRPGGWTLTSVIDVRIAASGKVPRELAVHIGSARTPGRARLFGDTGVGRITLRDPLPLHVGDRLLLRDPGSAEPAILGATVLDVTPPELRRRGAATAAGAELARWPDRPAAADLLRRHGLLRAGALTAMGAADVPVPVAGDWAVDPGFWKTARQRLAGVVTEHAKREPLAPGMPVDAARAALGLPDRRLVEALAGGPVRLDGGTLRTSAGPARAGPPSLPEPLVAAVRAVLADLAGEPFRAPEADRLRGLGLDGRAVAAAARAGLLLRISDQIVLAPGADVAAARALGRLPQPFTTAEARKALGTTRRVAIPLLEFLDRARITERLPDDRRRLR